MQTATVLASNSINFDACSVGDDDEDDEGDGNANEMQMKVRVQQMLAKCYQMKQSQCNELIVSI